MSKKTFRVGISGWNYPPWRSLFYPAGLKPAEELSFAAQQINTIEINGSFYSLKRPTDYKRWYQSVPDDFKFTVKGPRFISHIKKLHGVEIPLANFFASGVLELRDKLGPILWQFPERQVFKPDRFKDFFELLPKTLGEAQKLARKHDEHVQARVTKVPNLKAKIQYAFEIRHDSFASPEFYRLLKKYKFALVVSDGAGRWPTFKQVTAKFSYLRLHGGSKLYTSGYDDPELAGWIRFMRKRGGIGDVYCYFDNDVKARAPFDAMEAARRLNSFKPAFNFDVKRSAVRGPSKIKERKLRSK